VAAGGTRTRRPPGTPKHPCPLPGKRLIGWVIEAAQALGPHPLVGGSAPDVAGPFDGVEVAVQPEPRGTGDAVAAARERLARFEGDVLVVSGDVPALTGSLLQRLLDTHREAGAAATVLSFEPSDLADYGRVLRDGDGLLRAIVEATDASAEELAVREVNS